MQETIKVEIGVCKTCKHYSEEWDDPGAQDCSLSPGKMLVDALCAKEEEVAELGNENTGQDGDNQCPLWEMFTLSYCKEHRWWCWDECCKCMEEAFSG